MPMNIINSYIHAYTLHTTYHHIIPYMWVSRFKYKITGKFAPTRFEIAVTSYPAHVGGHDNQLIYLGALTYHL